MWELANNAAAEWALDYGYDLVRRHRRHDAGADRGSRWPIMSGTVETIGTLIKRLIGRMNVLAGAGAVDSGY